MKPAEAFGEPRPEAARDAARGPETERGPESGDQERRPDLEKLPKAKKGRDWKAYFFWVVPVAAVALAAWFIYSDAINKGPKLHIYFADASGLEAGKSKMKYRGAEIGKVEEIALTPDRQHVDVEVALEKSAKGLARENSKFWIVRAQVSVAQIQGLGTIMSGDYLTVEPGDGKPATKFQGLAQAPVIPSPGALQIELLSERAGSMKPDTPVFYRGIQVGKVSASELGPHAQTVRATVDIEKRYAPLVRMNSMFWNAGGINVNVGLTGADISAQSARTLLGGGIDFATPDTTQKQALPGTSFRLYDKAQEAWQAWAPAIDLGPSAAMPGEHVQSAGAQ
jgi:paraquat-inducible protein B